MFGIGKKDEDGKQVRIEHRGENIRASRTGGVAVRAEQKVGDVNITVNSAKGVRVNTRIAKGARVAMQNGRFQLIGRWKSGPLGVNVSKTGVSASYKNEAGTFNFLKPQYSSFKVAGVQFRGKKAAQMQLAFMLIKGIGAAIEVAVKLAVYLSWLVYLAVAFIWDFLVGFFHGVKEIETDQVSLGDNKNRDYSMHKQEKADTHVKKI